MLSTTNHNFIGGLDYHPRVKLIHFFLGCILYAVTQIVHLMGGLHLSENDSFGTTSGINPLLVSNIGEIQQQRQRQRQILRNEFKQPLTEVTNTSSASQSHSQSSSSLSLSSPPPRNHPHAGAKFSDGRWGYVADVTNVRRMMIGELSNRQEKSKNNHNGNNNNEGSSATSNQHSCTSSYIYETERICNVPLGTNIDEEYALDMLTEHFEVTSSASDIIKEFESTKNIYSNNGDKNTSSYRNSTSPRVLCVVYIEDSAAKLRLPAIKETWGWRCDGFFAASTRTVDDPCDPSFGSIDLPHQGEEAYGNMWQKTRSILGYIHDNYLEEFDYFHILGDDALLVVENLKNYLGRLEDKFGGRDNIPIFTGAPCSGRYHRFTFALGGPGYTINRLALKIFGKEALDTCHANVTISEEDRYVARCFRKLGIPLIPESDEMGRTQYLNFDPAAVKDIFEYQKRVPYMKRNFWAEYEKYLGEERVQSWKSAVSPNVVALHWLKTPMEMKRAFTLLYTGEGCPKDSVVRKALEEKYSMKQ